MNKLNIWTSYHLQEIENYYNLKENDGIKLFCTSKELDKDNINSLHKYYCELCTMYYAWKNCQSEYVGFQHYRYLLTYNNIDPLNNGYDIMCECGYNYNYFYTFKKGGFNDYIIIKCINYISKITGINKSDLFDKLYNDNFVFICNTFICKWDIFDDLCKFIFGLLNYLIDDNWKNEQNIINSINIYKEYFYHNNIFYNIDNEWNDLDKCDIGWPLKVNLGNRFYIFLFEWIIPFYCIIKQYNIFNIASNIRNNQYKCLIVNGGKSNLDYEAFLQFHRKNIFTGIRNILIYNYHNNAIEYLLNDMGEDAFKYTYKYVTLFENKNDVKQYVMNNYIQQENLYKCKINEYIDVKSPFDFYENNNYEIKQIN